MTLVLQLAILFGIAFIIWRLEKIMSTLADVQASFAKFVADIKAEVDALQAKIDAGNSVESADLDTLKAQIDAADAAVPPAA